MTSNILQLLIGVGVPANIAILLIITAYALRRFTVWETKLQVQLENLQRRVDGLEANIKTHLDNGLTSAMQSLRVDLERVDARCQATHGAKRG